METRIALIQDGKVLNVLVGDLLDIKSLFQKNALVVETEATGLAWTGARYNGIKFESLRQFESWAWNEELFIYEPPTPKPSTNHYWNEEALKWLEVPEFILPTLEEMLTSGLSEDEANEILTQIQAEIAPE
jgi:hypothetical protein